MPASARFRIKYFEIVPISTEHVYTYLDSSIFNKYLKLWVYARSYTAGGNSSTVQAQLTSVQNISSTNTAFAALRANVTVVTWGDPTVGGDSSAVQADLVGIQKIYYTQESFFAEKENGSLVGWPSRYAFTMSPSTQLLYPAKVMGRTEKLFFILPDGSVRLF